MSVFSLTGPKASWCPTVCRRAHRIKPWIGRNETQADLAGLPDGDRVVVFDAHRARILALPEAIAAASSARREELCRIVIERVVVTSGWTRSCGLRRPALSPKDSRCAPKGAQAPARCLLTMTIRWRGT